MSDGGDMLGNLRATIPEFYYDLIARIAPGSIVVGLYVYRHKREFLDSENQLLLTGGVLVATYCCGLLLDLCGSIFAVAGAFIMRKGLPRLPFIGRTQFCRTMVFNANIRDKKELVDDKRVALVVKTIAEKSFLRSAGLIWLVMAIWQVTPVSLVSWPFDILVIGWLFLSFLRVHYYSRTMAIDVYKSGKS